MLTAAMLRAAARGRQIGAAQFAARAAAAAPRSRAPAPATPDWAAADWADRLNPDATAKAAAAVLRRRLTALGAQAPAALKPVLARAASADDVAPVLDTVSAWRAAAVARGQAGILPRATAAAVVAAARAAGGPPAAAAALARAWELGLSKLGAGSYARVARALAADGDVAGATAVLRSAVEAGVTPTPTLAAAVAYAAAKAGDADAASALMSELEGVRLSASARKALERAGKADEGEAEGGAEAQGDAPPPPDKEE